MIFANTPQFLLLVYIKTRIKLLVYIELLLLILQAFMQEPCQKAKSLVDGHLGSASNLLSVKWIATNMQMFAGIMQNLATSYYQRPVSIYILL